MAFGGVPATGGAFAGGGAVGTGGATSAYGGMSGSGGYSGNDQAGGMGGASTGSGGSSASNIPAGAFLSVSVVDSMEAGTLGYACGVRTDGTVACWGDNTYGEATPPAGTYTSVSVGSSAA